MQLCGQRWTPGLPKRSATSATCTFWQSAVTPTPTKRWMNGWRLWRQRRPTSHRLGCLCALSLRRSATIATGRLVIRNTAGLYAGRVSSIPVQQHPGEVSLGSIPSIVTLAPAGINSGHISALDDARFITFRTYEGMPGFYVNDGRIMAPPTSDYQQVETRRTVDKASREVRLAGLRFHKGPATPGGIAAFQAALQVPLGVMIADGEIMGGRVVIPAGQNVLSTGKLRAQLRIVPVPIMREIELEIGLENPFAAAATGESA